MFDFLSVFSEKKCEKDENLIKCNEYLKNLFSDETDNSDIEQDRLLLHNDKIHF